MAGGEGIGIPWCLHSPSGGRRPLGRMERWNDGTLESWEAGLGEVIGARGQGRQDFAARLDASLDGASRNLRIEGLPTLNDLVLYN
jgi:hypothetical protein